MSLTFETADRFERDHDKLNERDKARFHTAVMKFVADLQRGGDLRGGLRIREMAGHEGVYEFTWAPDGRATFSYGDEHVPGERHVIWRRIGTHDIYKKPPKKTVTYSPSKATEYVVRMLAHPDASLTSVAVGERDSSL